MLLELVFVFVAFFYFNGVPNWLSVAMIVFLYTGTIFSDCQPTNYAA